MTTIIADTTSCLSIDMVNKLGIPYLPQIIVFGEQTYRDDTELNSEAFLQRLKSSPSLPKTSAPQPFLYTPIYEELYKKGESMIVVCPSTDVSGTFRSATVAAQDFPKADINIIDTRTIGSGLGELVLFAHQLVLNNHKSQDIIAAVKEMASREKLYFLVNTLEYLYKGGRIGGAKALVGSVLQVKPILEIRNGRAEAVESQRTKNKALARFRELIYKECPVGTNSHLSIMHGGNIEEATTVANEFSQKLNIKNIPIYYLPPAIMVHAGPGVLAVSFFRENL
jgi:DegV family protein with EDD domain